ncbi:MAG: HD domain-containing protein [Bacteroidales bacterium]|nr:HD domain-containing protein [Bacteroidales bacterium]MCM1415824.1 HD domain-containing protein [bacterium]MCM1423599.1 HD domain-containing protein [bacterium]
MKDSVILIVDDVDIDRGILCEIFSDYTTLEAANGRRAVEIIKEDPDRISAVLLDLVMPVMNGLEVMDEMRKNGWLSHIPVILISGEATLAAERMAYEMGATDVIHKPYDSVVIKRRTQNIMELYYNKRHLEEMVELQTGVLKKQAVELQRINNRIIDTMSNVVEFRNLESGDHVRRVKQFTRILAEQVAELYPEYHLDEEMIDVITAAAAMHDVGKIAISDAILLKPGKLTEEEFTVMKTHTTKGCEIIEMLEDIQEGEYGRMSYEICRYHHERYDGGGYPEGLKGEEIPIAAQIVSVADVYDALVSDRCYKSAYAPAEAYDMIMRGECGKFSPKILTCLARAREAFEREAAQNKG